MNKTGKPIDVNKYPLITKMYNLVREIDGLPASTEATYLVVKASELMDEVWNYLESHQPKDRLSGLMVECLEKKYKGKEIKNKLFPDIVFKIDHIEVSPDGPDPQMNVILSSQKYQDACKVYFEWQKKNNPTGGVTAPLEIQKPWDEASKECYWMSQVDDVLPEIVS